MVLLFVSLVTFSSLIQSLSNLQIHNVLKVIGNRGRRVIRSIFPRIGAGSSAERPHAVAASFDPAQARRR